MPRGDTVIDAGVPGTAAANRRHARTKLLGMGFGLKTIMGWKKGTRDLFLNKWFEKSSSTYDTAFDATGGNSKRMILWLWGSKPGTMVLVIGRKKR